MQTNDQNQQKLVDAKLGAYDLIYMLEKAEKDLKKGVISVTDLLTINALANHIVLDAQAVRYE